MTDKEITTVEETTKLEESQQGPVVATQWPTEVKFTQSELSAKETVKGYSHLKQLDPDDKDGYKELTAAIADVKKTRVGVGHEEKEKKEPLNTYLKLILETSRKIRAIYSTEEDRLRAEKKRLDDIKAERKLEQQRLWQENLGSISLLTADITALTQLNLVGLLGDLNEYDFKALDFGDYLDQAKTAVATAVNVVTERIEFMKEQKRLADQRLWQGNLNTVNNWATRFENETDEGLQVTIERLENFDIDSMEFGDYLEDAKTGVLAALNRALHEDKRRSDAKAEEERRVDQMFWQGNLDSIRGTTNGLPTMALEKLEALAITLNDFDIGSLDFGDYLEQAKATIAAQIASVNERLGFLKEQKKRDEEKAASDKKAEEDAAEMQRMRDKIAAMEKEKEPDPEPEGVVFSDNGDEIEERMQSGDYVGVDMASEPDKTEMVIVSQGEVTLVEDSLIEEEPEYSPEYNNIWEGKEPESTGRAAAIEQENEQERANVAIKNDNAIGAYIDSLKVLSNETPAFEDNGVYQRSVDKVNAQLLQMISFLETKTTVVG